MAGSRDCKTRCASSATAASTQPPLTEPAILPLLVTAILAPSGRGAEPCTAMTVASATCSPAAFHSCSLSMRSFILLLGGVFRGMRSLWARGTPPIDRAQRQDQLRQTLQIVCGQEVVDVGQRRFHPGRLGTVILAAEQRIQPDQAIAASLQPAHLAAEQLNIPPVPAIADDDDDRAVRQHAARPALVEFMQAFPDARAASPIGYAG